VLFFHCFAHEFFIQIAAGQPTQARLCLCKKVKKTNATQRRNVQITICNPYNVKTNTINICLSLKYQANKHIYIYYIHTCKNKYSIYESITCLCLFIDIQYMYLHFNFNQPRFSLLPTRDGRNLAAKGCKVHFSHPGVGAWKNPIVKGGYTPEK